MLSGAFRMAAFSLTQSRSALGAFYRRLRSRLGAPKAITATAHKLARLFYRNLYVPFLLGFFVFPTPYSLTPIAVSHHQRLA